MFVLSVTRDTSYQMEYAHHVYKIVKCAQIITLARVVQFHRHWIVTILVLFVYRTVAYVRFLLWLARLVWMVTTLTIIHVIYAQINVTYVWMLLTVLNVYLVFILITVSAVCASRPVLHVQAIVLLVPLVFLAFNLDKFTHVCLVK